jgi:hypothetical protein
LKQKERSFQDTHRKRKKGDSQKKKKKEREYDDYVGCE